MKNNIIVFIGAVIMMMVSCKKYEETPLQGLTEDYVFDPNDINGDYAKNVLADIYTYLPNGYNRVTGDLLDAASDDAIPSRTNREVEYFTTGRINSTNNPDEGWATSYRAIRASNVYQSKIGVVPLSPATKQYWKAEARFVRAMAYFELLKRYGGVPLIGNKILTLDDNLDLPRNTFAACVTYIVNECDTLKTLLRPEPVSDADVGRATRGAAIALKARMLLYAASPLYNGGGTESDPVKKALTGYPSYDVTRWANALAANDELINLGVFSLVSPYATTFTARKNTEVILAKQRAKTFDVETNNAPIGYSSPATSYGYTSPTQELVNAFPMLNGLAITDAASGYNAAAPYTGRDPRFALNIFYNGLTWLQRPVETYEGGRDKPGGLTVQTRTGYYMRKFMADFTASTAYSNQDHNFIIFRYAEILLSKAECLNELDRTAEAYQPLKDLRRRAGITAGTATMYGLKVGMTKDEMRVAIQNERRIEMAFEEQRFWDIRRWKIAAKVLNGTLHGIKIIKNTDNSLTYSSTEVSTVIFNASKMYHMPLPYAETTKNLNLIQNEGW